VVIAGVIIITHVCLFIYFSFFVVNCMYMCVLIYRFFDE